MKKVISSFFFVTILIIAIVSYRHYVSQNAERKLFRTTGQQQPQTEEYCLEHEAEYWGFANGCMDYCDYKRNPNAYVCSENAPWGCYCGKDKCWNGQGCEDL